MALQFLYQGTGLLKQLVIAAQFGTSAATDGYLIATTIIGVFLTFITLPIRQILIPLFRYNLVARGESIAWSHAALVVNNLAVLLLGVVSIG